MNGEFGQRVRLAAFQWLRTRMDVIGEVRAEVVAGEGFAFDGVRVPLLGSAGALVSSPRLFA